MELNQVDGGRVKNALPKDKHTLKMAWNYINHNGSLVLDPRHYTNWQIFKSLNNTYHHVTRL